MWVLICGCYVFIFVQDLKLRWLLHPLALLPHCWNSVELHISLWSCRWIFSQSTIQSPQWPRIRWQRECKIIIWDDCTMVHKRALEAVYRSMKDLQGDSRRFSGAMILLSGDFRQTLLVIPKSTATDEFNARLKSSYCGDMSRYLNWPRTTGLFQVIFRSNSSGFSSTFNWLLRWQSINRHKANRWKSVGSISNFHVFRAVSCTRGHFACSQTIFVICFCEQR